MLAERHFFQFGNMSRIGLQKITIPDGVQVSFQDSILTVKGPKGELARKVRDEISFTITEKEITVEKKAKTRLANGLWGTYASHAKNMIAGVTEGYKKELEVRGIGYRVEMKGTQLVLHVGFSHPVVFDVPEGLQVGVQDVTITIEGFDKEKVGQFAAQVRRVKKPDPYKDKGVRYVGEVVRRKQGKKAEATA